MSDHPTDLELIERCLNQDQAAWEEIIGRYKRKVFGIAFKFTGRFEEAEDLTQEVFFKVYKALATYKKEQDFSWWLVSISRNACIDYYRSVKRERKILSDNFDERGINAGVDEATTGTRGLGRVMSAWHSGQIQTYLRAVGVSVLALVILYAWLT